MAQETVVVGAGLAAAHVVATLRERGYAEPVTLVGEEVDRPYERPPLSKGVPAGDDAARGRVRAPGRLVRRPRGRDPVRHRRDGGRPGARSAWRSRTATALGYDHLVLATGSSPRTLDVPGRGLDGVHTLRRLGDSDVLRDELAARSRLVVAGGGWIGLEVAAAARLAGLDVTVLEYAAQPLLRVLGPRARRRSSPTCTGRTASTCAPASGSRRSRAPAGRVTGVRVGGEVVPADLVLVGVGAAPNIGLAAAAGLAADPGRDHRRRAPARPPIRRCSRRATWRTRYNTALGHSLRVEHWDNAIRQGALAARSILGQDAVHDWQPYFYTDQYDLGMEYVGLRRRGRRRRPPG